MLNINFNLKSVKYNGERPINLIARWSNRKLAYSTQEKIHPKHFETEKGKKLFQRAKPSLAGFGELNARLSYIESSANTVYRKFLNDHHRIPEPEELKKLLDVAIRNGQEEERKNLMQFIRSFIKNAEEKINRDTGKKLAKETLRKYRNTLKALEEFSTLYRFKVDFETIDLNFYNKWMEYLTTYRQLSNATIGGYTKVLKTFLNESTDLGLNTNLTFKHKRFKVITEVVHKIYLNKDELMDLYNLNLSENKRLERVRDLFLVGCWTGFRFGDLVNIAPENIIGNKISIKTRKTGEVVVIPLHWMVKGIMERYADYPNSLPPAVSNTKMNSYLKEIAAMVPCLQEKVQSNITKGGQLKTETKCKWEYVTVHTARRSFATNLYLEGISSLTIMKLTSHKSEKVFLSYLKASAEDNANLLEKHWLKKEAGEAARVSDDAIILPRQPRLRR